MNNLELYSGINLVGNWLILSDLVLFGRIVADFLSVSGICMDAAHTEVFQPISLTSAPRASSIPGLLLTCTLFLVCSPVTPAQSPQARSGSSQVLLCALARKFPPGVLWGSAPLLAISPTLRDSCPFASILEKIICCTFLGLGASGRRGNCSCPSSHGFPHPAPFGGLVLLPRCDLVPRRQGPPGQ